MFKRKKTDLYLSDEEQATLREASQIVGKPLKGWERAILLREAKDIVEERDASRRWAARAEEEREKFEESIADIPAGRPMPPKPRPVERDPGAAMTFDEYREEEARVLALHRERLKRLDHCQHPTVNPGESCPKCLGVNPAGSGKIVRNKPAFRFHVPGENGFIT